MTGGYCGDVALTDEEIMMKVLWEIYKGKNIYFDYSIGQFVTDGGYSSYIQSSARFAAINGF